MDSSTPLQHDNLPFQQLILHEFSSEIQLRPQFVIFFLLKGEMSIQIYEKEIKLYQHDIFFLKPEEVHSVICTSKDVEVLTLFADTKFLTTYCQNMNQIFFSKHVIRQSDNSPLYIKACSHIANLIFYTIKNESASQLKILSEFSALLSLFIDAFGAKEINSPANDDYVKERITKSLDYLNDNYSQKITLSSIADYLGIHPQYFSTFFKKHFHMNFVDYLNLLRIGHSVTMLTETDYSITDIAFSCGFSNHKTYSGAFKKKHGMTPTEYRKTYNSKGEEGKNIPLRTERLEYFSFFQRFWHKDSETEDFPNRIQNHMSLSFNLVDGDLKGIPNNQVHFYSVGRASVLLRYDVQMQVRDAKKELNITGLRLRDIFSDDLFVYYEDENKNPIMGWQYIDAIFDFLLSINIKPFPEIGYMPKDLASKKQYAGWRYQPNVSFPKSLKKWSILITSFMEHLIDRYGITEVRTWYFDFWTAPNLNLDNGYWHESQSDFYLFYRVTYNSMKNVDEELQIGTPNFSLPTGGSWYEDFFEYCKIHDLHPSYVCTHLYSCNDNYDFGTYTPFVSTLKKEMVQLHYEKDTLLFMVQQIKDIMKKYHLENLPLVASDWNNNYFSRDLTRDTCFMSPYVLYNSIKTIGQVDILSYHSLSDIHEDFYPNGKLFYGGPGLIDFYGLKKASYYAFTLLEKLGPNIVEKGDNYIFTSSDRGYQFLMFNFVYYDSLYTVSDSSLLSYDQRYNIYENSEDLIVNTLLKLPESIYTIKKTELNRKSGSVYDLWMKMGSPQELDAKLIDYILKRSIPDISYSRQEVKSTLLLQIPIPAHGAVLLEIEKNIH